uniref:Cystatin domain-containing protein n=1 Tax=Sinocyclocheilus anshuiensis TaxID=1608454 RepID=A0A671R5R5_9TELE
MQQINRGVLNCQDFMAVNVSTLMLIHPDDFGFAFVPSDSQPAKMVCILTLFASIFSAFIVSGDNVKLDYNHNVINVANFAMDVHNRMSSYPYAFKVVDILSDAAQLYPPARVKYTLQIQAAQTVCENHASVNLTDCALQSNAEIMTCSFTVIAVPGNDYIPKHLLSDHCV